ncbi:MAG TPA: ROK family protein [Candidatus Acidoferrum sp.]|jgi:glucokinase|nr:ROK family protein [Candidatus Acidoferrum sp.]
MSQAIGVDLGGSHVMAAVVSANGMLGKRHELDLTDLHPDVVVDALHTVIRAALADADGSVAGIGIGSPGNIDSESGTVRYSPNFGWENVPLGARLRTLFPKLPILVANDARCATLGEYVYGVGAGTDNFVLLTLGTGIGGGIVAKGTLLLGHMGGAGEIGHHQIRPDTGFVCFCGKIGCFESQASGMGLLRHAARLAESFPRSTLLDVPREKLGSKAIRKAAQAGDPHAVAAFNAFCDDLALGLANVIAFVNPEVIALGGGVSSAGEFLLEKVRPLVDARTTMVPRGTTRIVRATLGNDAGAVGAATAAMRGGLIARVESTPSVA